MKKIQDCRLSKWVKEEKLCLVITSIPLGHWTCPENSQNSNKTLKKSSIWITHTIGSVLSPLPIQRSKNLLKEASLKSPDKSRWMSIVRFQRAHQFESDTIYWAPSLAIELQHGPLEKCPPSQVQENAIWSQGCIIMTLRALRVLFHMMKNAEQE